jgi:hypothetical protein
MLKRLRLEYHKLFLTVAFTSKLRRYSKGLCGVPVENRQLSHSSAAGRLLRTSTRRTLCLLPLLILLLLHASV